MQIWAGIGYDGGLETFLEKGKADRWSLRMRAEMNRDKNFVVFEVDINEEDAEAIQKLMKQKKYKEALLKLKERAINLRLEEGQQRVWSLIPNNRSDTIQNKLSEY